MKKVAAAYLYLPSWRYIMRNKIPRYKYFILLLLITSNSQFCHAQTASFDELVYRGDSLNMRYPREKIFIHTDKPVYSLRDTIWLKGYILSGPANIARDSSRIVYIELINANNELLKRISTPCNNGLFAGSISLSEKLFGQGTVRIRTYTRYSVSFGDSLFFDMTITIIDPRSKEWKTVSPGLRKTENGGQVTKSGKGSLPAVKPDLQFLPEGGTWVAGLQQRLGFKAISTSGKGMDVKGVIRDAEGNEITRFASIHKGMGIVTFTPHVNFSYTAYLENGMAFKLPVTQRSGVILQVFNEAGGDSLLLKIAASPDLQDKRIYFTGRTGGVSALRGMVVLPPQGYILKISKDQLLSGITVFTLYDESLTPLCSRAVFIRHHNDLQLTLASDKIEYGNRDSVSLSLLARNSAGENINGSFSMAVIDTSQVNISASAENLLSYMLLSSDLKGEIEDPAYYFGQPDPDAVEALLLTQGWVSYANMPAAPVLPYEKAYRISGQVTNIFNKPLAGTGVSLFAKTGRQSSFILDTVTNKRGEFSFADLPYLETDSVSILISARNKKGKAFDVGIQVDEPVYPAIHARSGPNRNDMLLNDTLIRNTVARQSALRARFLKDSSMLEEVVLHARLRIPGSKNLNEDGAADQVIVNRKLEETPKETLLSVLEKQVPGFRIGNLKRNPYPVYMINSNVVRLVIDGVDIHFFYHATEGVWNDYQQFIRSFLNSFSAEEIRAIEIMNSGTNAAYRAALLSPQEKVSTGSDTYDFSFIEVTTQTGLGPFQHNQPGMYLLKPVYPVLARQFYTPKYTSGEQPSPLPDLRSTVYWNPDIVTDNDGKYTVTFRTSDSKSGYLIILQGTDLKGNFGILYQPLQIKAEVPAIVK